MGEDRIAIVLLEDLDLIFAKTPGRAEMEITRVLVTKGAIFDFGALAPVGSPRVVELAKMVLDSQTQPNF
jgi:hypothetical protein